LPNVSTSWRAQACPSPLGSQGKSDPSAAGSFITASATASAARR
jgi:hypothetical protein